MEENKNNIENTKNKQHEEYAKEFKLKYNLENNDLNTSTKVLLFKFTEEDEDGNYIGKKDLKGIDSLGSEQYYTQVNACYATTIEQIKFFEDIRHYYFTSMDNSILKDNFNIQMEEEDSKLIEQIKDLKEEKKVFEEELKKLKEELNKYRQSKLGVNNIKDLRKKFEVLISQNLKNINKNKISKYYKIAYTAKSLKIIETYIELLDSIEDVKREINENNRKKNLKAKVVKNKIIEIDEIEEDLLLKIDDKKNLIRNNDYNIDERRKKIEEKKGQFKSMQFVLDLLCLDKSFYESVKDNRTYIQLVICVSDNNTKKLKLGKNVNLNPEEFKKNKQEYVDELFDMDNNNSENNVAIYSKYVEYDINQDAKTFKELFMKKKIDYVQKFQKFNSCFLNCIVNDYKKAFDVLKEDGKRR